MKTLEKEIIDMVKDQVRVEMDNEDKLNSGSLNKIAKNVEKVRKFRVKDYDAALSYFKNVTYFMKEGEVNTLRRESEKDFTILIESKKVVEQVIENRRTRNRSISKVDTNLITHAPYFVGGSRKRRQKAKEEQFVSLDKGGIRKVSYENEKGQMLTMSDAKTLFALFTLWEKQGYQEWIKFTEYQLLETLRLKDGGNQYAMIRNSIEKLWNTSIVMQEAYDVDTGKREVTKRFKLIVADRINKEFSDSGDLRSKKYEVQFSQYVNMSIKGGYYSIISLAVLNELEVDTAQGVYLLLTGINDMERNGKYLKEDGGIEIGVEEVYSTLFLESSKYRNRDLVKKGCNELKDVGVIRDFHFTYEGKVAVSLVLYPSDWYSEMIQKRDTLEGTKEAVQLSFEETEGNIQDETKED